MTYPLVAELADAAIPVTVSCRVLKLARQPYYRWRNDPVRDADVLRAYRINALHDAHHDGPTFGYRYLASGRVADEPADGVEAVLASRDPLVRATSAPREGKEGRPGGVLRPQTARVPR